MGIKSQLRVRRRPVLWWGGSAVAGLLVLVVGANAWLWLVSSGHRSEVADAPAAPVVIVPGAKVAEDGTPMSYLRGRLDAAIDLVRTGKAAGILVSGDAGGVSGDEIASMTSYLARQGIEPGLVRSDPEGLSTRATCERAQQLFGVDRALIVTQYEHLPRAVALCRSAGIDAHGVTAYCECRRITVLRNNLREWFAAPKAIFAMLVG
ncbi:SanA/YdcF family protein [Nocardia goodfellowii]|uniref:Vancomycin permeability regulator SanA n=1 Tax=Nocardia goodfellowii TaxID=882446 RepID=A0ABS4QHL3_9NOCA|nr:ElyC/SanA/YdcF family protein [Nocardia goodfellowii]MBP2190569.1 vancomycin permeability regulator SanA [Nocardia goodfellowii]